MSNAKARRVDFSPDEYIAGVGGVLRADEQGVYWMICSLLMSEGGAIEQNDRRLAALCLIRPTDAKRIVEALVIKGKILRQSDGKLFQKRAQSEVERSMNRIQTASENGSKGGRPSQKNKRKQLLDEPEGFSSEKLTTNYQLPTTNDQLSIEIDKSISVGQKALEDEFENSFWPAYPKKVAKGAALKAFRAARKKTALSEIVDGAKRYANERRNEDSKYTKAPASWLNATCWLDQQQISTTGNAADWRDDPAYAGIL